MISKLIVGMTTQERDKNSQNPVGDCRIDFQANDSRMSTEGQYNPVTKMFVKRHENVVLGDCFVQNLFVICPVLTGLKSPQDIETLFPQRLSYIPLKTSGQGKVWAS